MRRPSPRSQTSTPRRNRPAGAGCSSLLFLRLIALTATQCACAARRLRGFETLRRRPVPQLPPKPRHHGGPGGKTMGFLLQQTGTPCRAPVPVRKADPRRARRRTRPQPVSARAFDPPRSSCAASGGSRIRCSLRASPLQWFGPKRFHAPPIALDDLPPIRGVLLSHDHYDPPTRPR